MVKRLGGWQVWVDVYKDYVVKTPKTKKEIAVEVKEFLKWQKKPMSKMDEIVDKMISDINDSKRIIIKSKVPRVLVGNAEFFDNKIKQSKASSLKDEINKLGDKKKIEEVKKLIDDLLMLVETLWEYGIHEKTFKFFTNYGLLDNKVILVDFLEVTNWKKTAEKQLRKKKWNKPDRLKETLNPEMLDYFLDKGSKILTVENLRRHWKKKLKER